MDISQLLSSLSEEDMKNLKTAAASLMGGKGEPEKEERKTGITPDNLGGLIPGLDAGMLNSVSKISSMMNAPDNRCDFLNSLKPLLSPERSKKIDSATQMLRLMSALSSIKELKL